MEERVAFTAEVEADAPLREGVVFDFSAYVAFLVDLALRL